MVIGHTPTADEVRTRYVPLIEKMFIETIKRDGRKFSRFTEINK